MSELTNRIIQTITSAEDFQKVLHDVAIAFKNKGFFDNKNWREELIETFKNVDVKVTDDSITDNEHEISSSFIVDDTSKFSKTSKTTITNPIACQSITNENMFDDSNDSFEIPETQPHPPVDHTNSDDHDSEGFITMPDDGFVANDCSQSQVLLQGTELRMQTPQPPDFDDSDTVDMEMSKLQWDDSTKENDHNKSASVTPELDIDFMTKQVTIKTADLEPVTIKKAELQPTSIENADDQHSSAAIGHGDFETQDLQFEPILAKSIFEALNSPQPSTLSKTPSSLVRNKLTEKSSICSNEAPTNVDRGNGEEFGIEKIEMSLNSAARDNKAVEDHPVDVEENNKNADEDQTKRDEPNEPVEDLIECEDEMPETQFFDKSGDDIENRADVEDQVFKKPGEPFAVETTKSNNVIVAMSNDGDDAIANMDETQLFSKPNASATEEDDAYDMETQAMDVVGTSPANKNQTSLAEGVSEHDKINVINVDIAKDKDTDKRRPKQSGRNKLLHSSDEEEEEEDAVDEMDSAKTERFVTRKKDKEDGAAKKVNEMDFEAPTQTFVTRKDGKKDGAAKKVDHKANDQRKNENDDAVDYYAQTQRFETKKPETPRRKRISELNGSDWEQLCHAANNNHENVVFKNVFDQCKDLRKVQANIVPVASVVNQNVATEAPTRQSARSRVKVKHAESNDAEPTTSKRQKLRPEPATFKAPLDPTTTKSDKVSKDATNATTKPDVPPLEVKASRDLSKASTKSDTSVPEVKASKVSSKTSSKSDAKKGSSKDPTGSSKQDETDENIDLNMPHTQVFVKASSVPQERPKPDPPRRQARAATTTGQKTLKPTEVQQLSHAARQSVSYSPKASNGKVSSDENVDDENNVFENAKPKGSDQQVKSSGNAPRQTRKRKAAEETISDSMKRKASDLNDSVTSSSTRSRSPSLTRSMRNNQSYPVIFTMVDPASHKTTLKKLNISIVTEIDTCNALITDKVYRTSKFMCAVAAGKPIVSIDWINAMKAKNSMIDPFEYVLKDAAGEKKYHFNLVKTLENVRKNGGLYRNHSIFVTPGTSPSPDILKDIIASSGGKYLKTSLSARKNDSVLCISAQGDEKLVASLKKKYGNLKEITAEQFMQSIFQYKI